MQAKIYPVPKIPILRFRRLSVLLLLFFAGAVQAINITGRVTLDDGDPAIGASVAVKGSGRGTVTDVNGNYNLQNVEPTATLLFSYTGYETQEVPVNGRTTIDVTLAGAGNTLDQVVVIGYGTQKRSDLTGSIATVSSKDYASTPVYSLEQGLQGRAAGVQVTQASGAPGAAMRIQIRGVGTNGDTEPLYVIDGYPLTVFSGDEFSTSPLARLNPNDIESIDVLKDASAAAIYGARAANGVVFITTKKGKAGKTRVNYDAYVGTQQVWKTVDLLGEADYRNYIVEKYTNSNAVANIPANLRANAALPGNNTDWQDALFRTGILNSHNLRFSGGSDNSTYSLGLGYLSNTGTMLGTQFDRYSLNFNNEFKLGKRIRVGSNVNLAYTDKLTEGNLGGRRQIEHAFKQPATIPVFDRSFLGGYGWPEDADGQDAENPVAAAELLVNRGRDLNLLSTLYGSVEIINGLTYRINLGMEYGNGRGFSRNAEYEAVRRLIRPSQLGLSYGTSFAPLIEQTLNYNRDFGQHTINVLAGISDQKNTFTFLNGNAIDLPNDAIQAVNLGASSSIGNGTQEWALRGYMGRLIYDFADKYFLTATYRRDVSSRLPNRDNRSGDFQSFSAGWRIDKEGFMKNVKAISLLKIRGGWGTNGNDKTLGNYNNVTLNAFANYTFGGALSQGTTLSNLANPNIRWETGVQTNIGLDLGLFDDAITFTTDYFVRTTKDWILFIPPAPSLGLGGAPSNSGEIENRGVEFSLNYRQRKSAKFNYNIGANLTYVKNEVLSLGVGEPINAGNTFSLGLLTRTEEGRSVGEYYGFVMDGIFQTQAEVDAANALGIDGTTTPYQAAETAPGDIRFRDIAGAPDENGNPTAPDGKVDDNDRTYIGSPIPPITYGAFAGFNWGNLDFSMNLQGVHGNKLWNAMRTWTEDLSQNFNQGAAVRDRWTPTNPSNTMPRATNTDPNNNKRNSDRFVEDGSFMRIKNLTVGYRLGGLSRYEWVNNTRVYVTCNNLLTITKYTGLDPEIGGGNPNLGRGIDIGNYPQARTFMLGLQVGF
jgi:TonB-dependent starch-binding outer membrane protein SusC